MDEMERAATTHASVLVSGETGTGKELVARSVHDLSPRREGPFVAVDCGSLRDELFDSELFGHSRDAFTGAERCRPGKLLSANGGTLFLDSIDDLSLDCQTRLLRVVQEKEIVPLGRTGPRPVNFRLVTSVSHDFPSRLQQGLFRRDLYFRIKVVHLELPPLRERLNDVRFLAERFLRSSARRFQKPLKRFEERALEVLEVYSWPGNIRELLGVIECAVASARGEILRESDLPVYVRRARAERSREQADDSRTSVATEEASPPGFAEQVESFQRRLLIESLKRHGWSYEACGKELRLARHQVKYLCAKLGVRRNSELTVEYPSYR
jgi:transcriptional regulator with GAF, ATPase, and Fis domain